MSGLNKGHGEAAATSASSTPGLLWWWPSQERLYQVLISDAEAHSPAVALAVHQPMLIVRRHYSDVIDAPNALSLDETALLERLTEPVGDGCQITLIEGKSGTGKSHVVRWLEIQLARRRDRETRVLLPVSKGSRLRDIVTRLCERPELAGPKHADLRSRLGRAQEPIEPEDAAARLCNQLATVCLQRAEHAIARQEQGHPLTEMDRLQRKWGQASQLPQILVNQNLRPLFVGPTGLMRRLVDHINSSTGPLDDRREQEFLEADLFVDFESVYDGLDRRTMAVLGNLEDATARREASRVLNDALDEAKRILLNLGSGVVREVFASIREHLLLEGKELVLLIEDFADLSGLQTEILQASIDTGLSGGKKTQCTLRTVLAYTDGFIHKEQTVLSRAQYVFYVPSELDESRVIDQSVRLVASYLHAARVGAQELERRMQESVGGSSWIPDGPEPAPEDATSLRAFGDVDGVPLFPFTKHAITRLVRDHYEGKRSPLFVPRDIIRELMPRVLNHRDAYLHGVFPPEAFRPSQSAQLTSEQSEWLRRVGARGTERARLEKFVLYWGLSAGAARAFRLPEPDTSDVVDVASSAPGDRRRPGHESPGTPHSGPSRPPSTAPDALLFGPESKLLEGWRSSDITGPAERRKIRNAIESSLQPALAWSWSPTADASAHSKKRWDRWQEGIQIDGLRPSDDALPVTLVTPAERADRTTNESIARELTAVVGAFGLDNWDAPGVEDHLAAHLSFVERHRSTVERHLARAWWSRPFEPLPFLVGAVALTGAALGIAGCASADSAEFIDALFADGPGAADSEWGRTTLQPLAEVRKRLQLLLAREVGAFQGKGKTMHGLDAARFAPFLPGPKGELAPLPTIPHFPAGAGNDEDVSAMRSAVDQLRALDARSVAELGARRAAAERIKVHLGEALDKEQFLAALDSLVAELKEIHAVTEEEASQMRRTVIAVRKERVLDSFRAAERLVPPNVSLWQRLLSLGKNEALAPSLAKTDALLQEIEKFIALKEGIVSSTDRADPLDEAEYSHSRSLETVASLLGEVSSTTEATDPT